MKQRPCWLMGAVVNGKVYEMRWELDERRPVDNKLRLGLSRVRLKDDQMTSTMGGATVAVGTRQMRSWPRRSPDLTQQRVQVAASWHSIIDVGFG